jgi:hypothetical protein
MPNIPLLIHQSNPDRPIQLTYTIISNAIRPLACVGLLSSRLLSRVAKNPVALRVAVCHDLGKDKLFVRTIENRRIAQLGRQTT